MTPPPAVPAADGTAAAGAAALLAHRPWRRWVPTSALSRVPMAMAPLAVLLLGEHATGSLTSGVFLAGVFSLFSGAPGPFVGRLLDRFEMRRGLLWSLVAAAGSTILLLATAALGAPLWLYVLLCALQGLSMAGLLGGMRALLLVVAPPGNLRRAHFAESLMVELSAVLGPLLVGALALLGGADAALAGTALLCAAAGWAMRSAPALPPAPAAAATPLLPAVPVLRISLLVLCVSTGYGVLTANIPQRMADYGLTSTHATWVTAVFSTGACLGGVLASLRPLSADRAAAGTPLLLLASAAISLPAGLAQTVGGYAAALFASALLLVPLNGILVTRVEAELGLRRRAEGFSYFGAAATAGGSLGYLAASALAPLTTADRIAFLAPALHLALAGVLGAALISRGTPRARSTATEPTEGVSVSTLPSAPSPTESTSPRDEESRLR
ncbi:MFS transporter, partial [Thermobifida halotolerans]